MPVLMEGDSHMIIETTSYSPAAIERSFEVVTEFTRAGLNLAVIYDKATPRAAVINLDVETDRRGQARHTVLALLDLERKKAIGDNVIAVERFWQDDKTIAQIGGICVDPKRRENDLATILYETLVLECGVILISDNEQYAGGKALWQRIARAASEIAVFVLDSDEGKFYPYDGNRVRYDGVSIPEDKIWSKHPDKSLWPVVLIAESCRKIEKLTAAA